MNMIVKIGERRFEVALGDLTERPIRAVVDGETFEVYPEEAASPAAVAPLRSEIRPEAPKAAPPPAPSAPKASGNSVTAALPGVIASISVRVGDSVTAGQQLCVIEAMKMQNVIRAPKAGKIGQIFISVGQTVKQRQPMLEYTGDES